VGHVIVAAEGRALFVRRLIGAAMMLATVSAFRATARLLPRGCPLRVWALSQSSTFPLTWGTMLDFAALSAPTFAD